MTAIFIAKKKKGILLFCFHHLRVSEIPRNFPADPVEGTKPCAVYTADGATSATLTVIVASAAHPHPPRNRSGPKQQEPLVYPYAIHTNHTHWIWKTTTRIHSLQASHSLCLTSCFARKLPLVSCYRLRAIRIDAQYPRRHFRILNHSRVSFGNLRIRADGAAEAAKAAGRRPLRGVTGVDGALRLSAGNGAKEKKGRIICTRRHCSARENIN